MDQELRRGKFHGYWLSYARGETLTSCDFQAIERDDLDPSDRPPSLLWEFFEGKPSCLSLPHVGRFALASGGRIDSWFNASLSRDERWSVLVHEVLPWAICLCGDLVIHASAIEFLGKTYLFTGPSGSGKSTLAALLAENGARVLSDDMVRVAFIDEEWRVFPGVPGVRLFPEQVRHLGLLNEEHFQFDFSKVQIEIPGRICDSPALGAVFVLNSPAKSFACVELRSGAAAWLELARNVVGGIGGLPGHEEKRLNQLHQIVESTSVFRLDWPHAGRGESLKSLLHLLGGIDCTTMNSRLDKGAICKI